jgi:hypothetical protein
MPLYEKSVRLLMKDFVLDQHIEQGQSISKERVVSWFKTRYPRVKLGTISAHLLKMSINAPSRIHYKANSNGDDDLFFQIDGTHFRLYEKENDPQPIYEKSEDLEKGESKQERIKDAEEHLTFVFFPYLKTSEPVQYKNLIFKNIDDVTDIPDGSIDHLNILRQMFFHHDDFLIKQITYTILRQPNEKELADKAILEQLQEFQTLITYLYSAPNQTSGDPFLSKENASVYLCKPKLFTSTLLGETHLTERISSDNYPPKNKFGEVKGYEVLLDFRSHLWVVKGSRIYPPVGFLSLNFAQDLHFDFNLRLPQSKQAPIITFILSRPERSHLSNRLLTALEWYNRSISQDLEEEVALIYLAIAFESLLNLDQGEKVTARFREAVNMLLGGVPRLDSWLTQFYDARSMIVHKGRSSNLAFLAIDDPKSKMSDRTPKYRSLVSVGRQIFRLCVSTITYGASTADELNLPSMFFTNQQRLEEICKTLSNTVMSAREKLLIVKQLIQDIDNYKFVDETGLRIETLISSAQLTVRVYLDSNPELDPELLKMFKTFSFTPREQDYYKALSCLEELVGYLKQNTPIAGDNHIADVSMLLEYVWGYTFFNYYWLKNKKEKETDTPKEDI